jgi:hypothetical protein
MCDILRVGKLEAKRALWKIAAIAKVVFLCLSHTQLRGLGSLFRLYDIVYPSKRNLQSAKDAPCTDRSPSRS